MLRIWVESLPFETPTQVPADLLKGRKLPHKAVADSAKDARLKANVRRWVDGTIWIVVRGPK